MAISIAILKHCRLRLKWFVAIHLPNLPNNWQNFPQDFPSHEQDRDGADAVMEHYFWHMGGLLGMARGVSTAGLPPAGASPAPARAAKDPVRRKHAAPRMLGLERIGTLGPKICQDLELRLISFSRFMKIICTIYIYIHLYIFMYIDEQVNTRMAFRKYLDCIYSQ